MSFFSCVDSVLKEKKFKLRMHDSSGVLKTIAVQFTTLKV